MSATAKEKPYTQKDRDIVDEYIRRGEFVNIFTPREKRIIRAAFEAGRDWERSL